MSRTAAYLLGVLSGASAALTLGALAATAVGPDPAVAATVSRPATAQSRDAPDETRRDARPRRSAPDPLASFDAGAIPPLPAARGRVSGRVLDVAGRPMAGVIVRAEPSEDPPAISERPTSDPDEQLRRELRDVVRTHRIRRAWAREGVTDAVGAYVVDGLTDARWVVSAERDGWVFTTGERDLRATVVLPGEWAAFTAHRCFDADVAVVLPDGTAPAAARVTACGGNEKAVSAWTPDAASVRLLPGKRTLFAVAGEDDELRSKELVVEVAEDAAPAPVRLELEELRGVIVAVGPGGDHAPCTVKVELTGEDGDQDWNQTAPGGRTRFFGIEAGRWTLKVSNGLGVEFHRELLDVGPGVVRREVSLPARDLRDWKIVRVLDSSGRPAGDVRFQSGYASEQAWAYGNVAAVRLDEERWRVPCFPAGASGGSWSSGEPDPCKATRRWVRAESRESGVAHAEIDVASASEVDMRLIAPARLVVRVEGAVEDGPELTVYAVNSVADPDPVQLGSFRCSETVRSGEAVIGRLPPRAARVWLEAGGQTCAETEVTLASGENRLTLCAPPFQDLRVTLPAGLDPPHVWMRRESVDGELQWQNPDTAADGVATWRHLMPGRYRVWCSEGDMPVTVPCASDLQLVPRAFTAVLFTPEADSPMHAAGLRSGDVCVLLDGAAFSGKNEISAVFAAARLKSKSTLAIVRGDRCFDLDLDLSKLALRWDYMSR